MNNSYDVCQECQQFDKCEKTVKHNIDISVPVDIKPNAKVGDIEMECCGEPVILCDEDKAHDKCRLLIVQKVCIKIPVKYTFKSEIGKQMTECCPPCSK